MARRHASALVQAGSQIPAIGMFGHSVQTATLPEPCPAGTLPRRLTSAWTIHSAPAPGGGVTIVEVQPGLPGIEVRMQEQGRG